jgi:3-isopropylmalate/(R)-2-methylmalate dehydratase small subunit
MNDYVFTGRALVITDENNQLISDIDTDQIFHNAHLHITEISEMGQHSFGNLEGWKDFPQVAQAGDVVISGENFGSGSSRQQAVDCFRALEVKLIIASSFGAIYKRNAINTGFPILVSQEIEELVNQGKIEHLQKIRVDLLSGKLENLNTGDVFSITPFSKVQKDIFDKGTLLRI